LEELRLGEADFFRSAAPRKSLGLYNDFAVWCSQKEVRSPGIRSFRRPFDFKLFKPPDDLLDLVLKVFSLFGKLGLTHLKLNTFIAASGRPSDA
jgi:hypothetical protein